MKRLLLFSFLFLLGLLAPADAANRFLTCNTTCTITAADTSIWGTTTGGTGASVPGSSDAVILDGATCVGGTTCTATMGAAYNPSWVSITMGACTASTTGCVLDFSANNNSPTLQTFSCTGIGQRGLNMGNGTWTMTGTAGTVWNCGTTTSLAFNANSSTLSFTGASASARNFTSGDKTYATVNFAANSSLGMWTINSVTNTIIGTLTATAPNYLVVVQGVTLVISNAFTIAGTSTNWFWLTSSAPATGAATVSVASGSPTFSYTSLRGITATGGATFTATNSLDAGGNTGITITPPSFGSGGGIIGG